MNHKLKYSSETEVYDKLEKYISLLAIIIITFLIGFNILRVYNNNILEQDYLVKDNYNFTKKISAKKGVTLTLESDKLYPLLEVLVNGKLRYKFIKNNELIINVNDGDVIQINGSMYDDNIRVRIDTMNSYKINYLNKSEIITKKTIETLAVIRM